MPDEDQDRFDDDELGRGRPDGELDDWAGPMFPDPQSAEVQDRFEDDELGRPDEELDA